eukprot:TRINITY_DN2760_c0_g1_i4.p1 TRINITY_DN2760_c0_g1~~TRINITY_DN2760_c0_g1_i4.p1  ORF type:complete len:253 (+),score=48.89 TRINITY_DN2760_c0_g1_i4:63-761(+)
MGKHWHAAHFVCAFAGCGLSVVQEFFEVEDKPYCLRHCVEVLRSFCPICQKPQGKQYVVALGSQYHPTCFCCYVCSQPLVSQTSLSFFQLPSGELLCAEHKDGAGLAKAQRKRSETLSDPDYRSAEMLRLMEELKKDLTLAQVLGIPSEPAVPEQQPAADGVAPPRDIDSIVADLQPELQAHAADASHAELAAENADLRQQLAAALARVKELEERIGILEAPPAVCVSSLRC